MKQWFSGKGRFGSAGPRIAIVATLIAVIAAAALALRPSAEPRTVSYTELVGLAEGGAASLVRIDGERFSVETKSGEKVVGIVSDKDSDTRHALVDRFTAGGARLEFESREQGPAARTATALMPILVMLAIGLVVAGVMQKRGKGHYSTFQKASSARPVRFADVAGMDEVKEALSETVEFLKSPARFGRLGGRPPRGVLLTGSPGTGKTLLARACANEAGVPFLTVSGSSFQEVFVGVGASRVRSLFAEARRLAPCIVFIDEIDAVGRARGRGGDSASADADQTLNQLLVEMDGFDHTSGIVVIASTNRSDVLDPALLRPGRFDRQIVVPLPDMRGRKEILRVHARPLALAEEIDLAHVARSTPGFSGAELQNLLNEAAILAAREGANSVAPTHIDRAKDRIMMGAERRGFLIEEDERHATAVHEAGHVAVAVCAPNADPVHKVSILPRGRALGVTQALPEKDRLMYRKEFLEDQICMLMGGRAAEIEILGTMTAGASDDISRASSIARKMVAELGMSELGCISVSEDRPVRSQALLDRVEEVARCIVEAQLDRARQMVVSHRPQIDRLVRGLLDQDTLDAGEIRACFAAPAAEAPSAEVPAANALLPVPLATLDRAEELAAQVAASPHPIDPSILS